MQKKYWIWSIIICALTVTACFFFCFYTEDELFMPSLKVSGDVKNSIYLEKMNSSELKTFYYKDKTFKGLSLDDVIKETIPVYDENEIFLISEDERVVSLNMDQIEESYLIFAENGWESINLNHPVNCNSKYLKEILVVSKISMAGKGFSLINSDKNLINITNGQLLTGQKILKKLSLIGQAASQQEKDRYICNIFQQQDLFELSRLVEIPKNVPILIMGKDGGYHFTYQLNSFEIKDNQIDYLDTKGNVLVSNVAGVILDTPKKSIMDVYEDSVYFAEENEPVLMLLLDGFGYHQYEYALENNRIPYLKNVKKADKATSVYVPVTNAGLAAMITGQPPGKNGVIYREKDLNTPSIFQWMNKKNKKALLIEGNIKILNTEIEPILNIDQNGNGKIDDEILQSALQYCREDYDYLMVHFHSIDDSGHNFGDLSEETMNTITEIDGYIQKLSSYWDGKMIITADHGMHAIEGGGKHGEFRYEDLIVPYLIIDL